VIQLMHGDCLRLMPQIPSVSVDMILCDLPYGTTACKWDTVIPFEPLWEQYKRIIKKNGAIVLFGSQPFTTNLIISSIDMFKYCWVWNKGTSANFMQASFQPLKQTEDICVFSFGGASNGSKYPMVYNAQGVIDCDLDKTNGASVGGDTFGNKSKKITKGSSYKQTRTGYPNNILEFSKDSDKNHPTQKPVPLCEYLIETYTNEGEWVLDNTMGSGTTGIACVNTGRKFIGIEQDDKYFQLASDRIYGAANVPEFLRPKVGAGGTAA